MDREPLKAVFSIDYHLALLRGKAGHDGYDRWAATPPSRTSPPDLVAPLELGSAVQRVVSLSRDARYRRHAAASCALGLVTAAHAQLPGALQEWRAAAEQLVNLSDLQQILGPGFTQLTPIEAYFAIAFIDAPCQIQNPKTWFTYDSFEVTTVGVEFDVDRALDDLKPMFDPRMWDVGAPESFQEADRIREIDRSAPTPGVASQPPPPVLPDELDEMEAAGTPWSDPLFENAVFAVGGATLIDFKNILRIKYDVEPSISMEYHLCEGLTLDIAGMAPVAGGLDRDCGAAEAWLDAGSGLVHVRASKSIRVDQPAGLRDFLNYGMAATLPFWFMNLVLLGICK
jgi:hypothetical protein